MYSHMVYLNVEQLAQPLRSSYEGKFGPYCSWSFLG